MSPFRIAVRLSFVMTAALLVACGGPVAPTATPISPAPTLAPTAAGPSASGVFTPDDEPDHVNFDELAALLGPVPMVQKPYKIGVVVKYLGNQYWTLLAQGMQAKATELGVVVDVQSPQSESDQIGQLALVEAMIAAGYDALLVSPQTDTNLLPAIEKARAAGILVLNVNDAVLPDAEHWVGPNQYENGVRAAHYLVAAAPAGGQVAVIEGQSGVYAAKQRTQGFNNTLHGTPFEVVASIPGDWDAQKSFDAATLIMERYPEIIAFYCNNDTMALGVVAAVAAAGKGDAIMVIGTDGVGAAYDSIRQDELTGTIDSFPYTTGQVAVEVAVRLLEGQTVPRAVFSPQNFITRDNVDSPQTPHPTGSR